jgi:hypothetical protein
MSDHRKQNQLMTDLATRMMVQMAALASTGGMFGKIGIELHIEGGRITHITEQREATYK